MKKSVLVVSMLSLLFLSGLNVAIAQEQPQPKKDTVNMDTQAKPEFYYAVEDDNVAVAKNGASSVTLIVAGAFGLVLVVGAVYFFLKKKK